MRFRGLIVAAVLLAALGGLLYWSQHHKPKATPHGPVIPAIVKVDSSAVTSLTLRPKGAPPIVLTPAGPSLWQITAPIQFRANSQTVSEMVATLADLLPQRTVEDKAADLSRYGLSDPSLTVDIAEKNNQSAHLILGDHTPTGDAVYAIVPGDPHVYTVSASTDNILNKSLDDLRNRHLVPVQSLDVQHLDLIRDGQDISIARASAGWQIQKPEAYRTDNYEVDGLVQQIVSATWNESTDTPQSAAAFAHGTPVATVKITTGSGADAHTDTLEVRKSRDSYYAKSTAVEGTWEVDSTLATALDRTVDDFRNKQLLNFGFAEPLNIEYHSAVTNLNLVRSDKDWYSDGKKMDGSSVDSLIDAIRGLAATKFVNSGYTKPDISLTIVTVGGRAIEKISFQKTPDGAIAKRSDSPGLYVLDSVTMNNLYTAAAGIKPAPPPARKK